MPKPIAHDKIIYSQSRKEMLRVTVPLKNIKVLKDLEKNQ